MKLKGYEADKESFGSSAYTVKGYQGIAFRVTGWETQPDDDTEWSGEEIRTGKVIAIMIGDDYEHKINPDKLIPISRESYCGSCGQMGCTHDGLERE